MELEIKNLNKNFKKNKVLDHISFTFTNGVYGILAPNGVGKTTLIRCICGLYKTKDNIFIDGISIDEYKKINSIIGYLPQNFGLFKELTVSEALQYFSNLKGIEASAAQKDIDNILNKVNLYNQKNEKIKSLSGGMIRRLGIAQALLGDPKILIFDEPTAGLDPEERLRFKNIISQIGNEKIVIISTHIVEDVESICNKIVIMKDGTIVKSGSCNEISESAKGMVYVLPQNELEIINTTYSIQKYFERDGNKLVRILSKIELPYNVVEPNVEDGYLCVLNII